MRANISWMLAMAPGLIVKNSLNDKDEVAIARNLHNYWSQLLGNSVSSSTSPPSPPLVVYLTEISFYCQPRLAE